MIVAGPVLGFAHYLGAFRKASVERSEFGPISFIYGTHAGPLGKLPVSWSSFLEEIESAGIKRCSALAVYLDPPHGGSRGGSQAGAGKRRVILGCRLGNMDSETRKLAQEAFPSFDLPKLQVLSATFPFKRNFASFFVGPMKVYPAMTAQISENNREHFVSIEIYSLVDAKGVVRANEHTLFAIPVDYPRDLFTQLDQEFDDKQ